MAGLGHAGGFLIGLCADFGTQTAYQVDSAYTFESAGEAVFLRFVATEAQTSGNFSVYFYSSAVTGSPTYKCEIRNGPAAAGDPDRPESAGSTLAVSGDVSPTASTWSGFSLTGLSLTPGQQYYAIIYNTSVDPATAYASWVHRAASDGHFGSSTTASTSEVTIFTTGYTIDGFSTDPTISGFGNTGSACIAYNSGTVDGFPYVSSETHANDANDRGNRLQFVENIKVYGHSVYATSSSLGTFDIRQGATLTVSSATSEFRESRSANGLYAATELTKATDYDFVISPSASTTAIGLLLNMGEAAGSLPADVLACRPGGVAAYVDGATPGSYTADTSKLMSMIIYVRDLVSATGGGGVTKLAGQGGGLVG